MAGESSHHNRELPQPRQPGWREGVDSSWCLRVALTVLWSSGGERGSYRLLVKGCGVFVRIRAAERGGTSGRGPEKVGTGWHSTSTGTFPKYSFLTDIICSGWAVFPHFWTPLCYSSCCSGTQVVATLCLGQSWHKSTEKGVATNTYLPF